MAVKNNLKLIFSYFKLNLKKEWKYKTSFFMQIAMMILNDLFFIIQWYIIFRLVDNIGGYGFNERRSTDPGSALRGRPEAGLRRTLAGRHYPSIQACDIVRQGESKNHQRPQC